MRGVRIVFFAVAAMTLVTPVLAQPSIHASPFVFDPGKTGHGHGRLGQTTRLARLSW